MVFTMLNPEQQQCLKEIDEYLQSESGAWAIGDEHLDLISFLLKLVFWVWFLMIFFEKLNFCPQIVVVMENLHQM